MKNFLDFAKTRHSVRSYTDRAVEKEKIQAILEAGRIAPSAVNRQPSRFLVLNDPNALLSLEKACRPHGAPMAIIVSADSSSVWTRKYDNHTMVDIDTTIATDHMMLCAHDLGLATCWITYFKPEIIRTEFNLPDNLIPVNILVIGYADEATKSIDRFATDRQALENLVQYNSY